MPAFDTLTQFQEHLELESTWRVDGRYYQRTAEAWLRNQDRHRQRISALMRNTCRYRYLFRRR